MNDLNNLDRAVMALVILALCANLMCIHLGWYK